MGATQPTPPVVSRGPLPSGSEPPRVSFLRSPWGWLLAAITALLCLAWLGDGTLAAGDGAVYNSAVRDMVRKGTWWGYAWHGARLYRFYPPLHFWLMRASTGLLGVELFALRLPSALGAMVCTWLVGDLAARLAKRPMAGFFAGLALLAGGLFFEAARKPMLDLTLLACALVGAWAWVRAREQPRYLVLLGVAAGAAYLSKSLFLVFLAGPVAVDLLWRRRELLRCPWLWVSLGVAIGLAGLWHVPLCVEAGGFYFPAYGVRAAAGLGAQYTRLRALGTWARIDGAAIPLYVAGLVTLVWVARRSSGARFWAAWMLLGLGALALSANVLQHYFLQVLPPLAIGAGSWWSGHCARGRSGRRWWAARCSRCSG